MKTLLRHTRTGLYFQGADSWTRDPHQAFDFRFIDRALSYMETWEMNQVELAFAFENADCLTLVPLDKAALGFAAA